MLKFTRALLISLFWSSAFLGVAEAQVIITPNWRTEFISQGHNLPVPQGEANAGQPLITGYQAYAFPLASDVTTGVPIATGVIVPKATVVATGATSPCTPGSQTSCPIYTLTGAQLGLTIGSGPNQIPPCTSATQAGCPQFSLVMVAIGPGGVSARGVLAESDPFTLPALAPTTPPVSPSQVKIKGS